MKNKEKTLEDFINFKRTETNTKSKIEGYQLYVSLFLNSTKKSLKDFSETELINFLNSILKKYSVGSMNCIKSMINSFCFWNFKDDYFKRFPHIQRICKAQITERKYNPEDMLTKQDIQNLVREENTPYWKSYWLLLFYGGFRPSEVCRLEWDNITFAEEGAYIKIFVRKNHKTFEKFIPDDVCFYLKRLQKNNSKYVFPTIRKHKHKIPVGDMPLTRSGVYQHLIPLAKRVLNKHINPYIIRHSIANILYKRDDLKDSDVAQQMGHSKAMKQTYDHPTVQEQRKRMKRIYISPEALPEERKIELEKEILAMKETQKNIIKYYETVKVEQKDFEAMKKYIETNKTKLEEFDRMKKYFELKQKAK